MIIECIEAKCTPKLCPSYDTCELRKKNGPKKDKPGKVHPVTLTPAEYENLKLKKTLAAQDKKIADQEKKIDIILDAVKSGKTKNLKTALNLLDEDKLNAIE